MIRFLVKSVALLGLAAAILPNADGGEGGFSLSIEGALAGLQEAAADLVGFCDRAPAACEAGREAAGFAAAKVGEGARLAYAYARGEEIDDGAPVLVEVTPRSMDPVLTGSLPVPAHAVTAMPVSAPARAPAAEPLRLKVDRAREEPAVPPRRAAAAAPPAPSAQRQLPRPYAVPSRGPAVPERPVTERGGEGVLAFGPAPSPAPKNNRAFAQIPQAEIPGVPAPTMPIPRPAPRA